MEINETEFSLAEVEQLTGISPELMRAWRKRGHVSSSDKYAKVKTTELASLVIKTKLMKLGYGPADSKAVSELYAPALIYHAVVETPAICKLQGTARDIAAFESEYRDLTDLAQLLSGTGPGLPVYLISTDGGPLQPAVGLSIDDDGEIGLFINLVGLGRQFGAADGNALFSIKLPQTDGGQSRELVRRFPRYSKEQPEP